MFAFRSKSTGKICTIHIESYHDDYYGRQSLDCTLGFDSTDMYFVRHTHQDLEFVLNQGRSFMAGGLDNPFFGDVDRNDIEIIHLQVLPNAS